MASVRDPSLLLLAARAQSALSAHDLDAFRRSAVELLPRVDPRLELLGAFAVELVDEGDLRSALGVWAQFVDAARIGPS